MRTVRELLEGLSAATTKRLSRLRGLENSRHQKDRITRLARSVRGDHDAIIAELTRRELIRTLDYVWETRNPAYVFEYTYLAQARLQELTDLARLHFAEGWEPTEDGEAPGGSAVIRVRLFELVDGEQYDDGYEDEDDEDEDDEDEDDEDEDDPDYEDGDDEAESDLTDFRSDSHARRLFAEFAYSPEHRGELREWQQEATAKLLAALHPERPVLLHVATGGGKTRIANDTVSLFLRRGSGSVFWVTKDWRLLWQAARDRCRRNDGALATIARIGGHKQILCPLAKASSRRDASVVYTTLQTIGRRMKRVKSAHLPSLVVWDECHWGEHAKLGRKVIAWCKKHRIPLVGLTATPRAPENSSFRVVYSMDYLTLVQRGYLARAIPISPVATGTQWAPERASKYSDIRLDSLRELGRNKKRNKLIVEHYRANAGRYQQTIIFACSIEHADELTRLLNGEHGIAARPVHSARSHAENEDALRRFESRAVHVLVNVAKLTMGYDFPEAKTIFMCRPTLSEILFSQMVGRAARLTTGKTTFNIVEFTDNVANFGDQLVTTKTYFQGALQAPPVGERGESEAVTPSPPSYHHRFDVRGAATWIPVEDSIPESLRGLWYRQGQTFGIEIELTSRDFAHDMAHDAWLSTAESLRARLVAGLGPDQVARRAIGSWDVSSKDHEVWNVEWDGSAGWEITSRILCGEAGYREIDRACAIITAAAEELGLLVNHRTGMHVHLGWLGRSLDEVKRAVKLARLFEPAVATLVAPSRLAAFHGGEYDLGQPNQYCRPISSVVPLRELQRIDRHDQLWSLTESYEHRYVSVNIKPLDEIHTVEIRLFNGTTEATKILLWLSLWQQILWAASNTQELPDVPDRATIRPDGDIIDLARKYLPDDRGSVLARLHARRMQVRELWSRTLSLASWVASSSGWSVPVAAWATPTEVAETALYFAYGANMSAEILFSRCPSAKEVGHGRLEGYRLTFRGASTRWGGGVATVISAGGQSVEGVLYEIPVAELAALDQAEGSAYQVRSVSISTAETRRTARIYCMSEGAAASMPSPSYLQVLQTEYVRQGFDTRALLAAMTS